MKIKDVINGNAEFGTVDSNRTVGDALERMTANDTSAVLVMEKKIPVGIFTERDLVRCHTKFPEKPIREIRVDSVMTSSMIVAELEDTVEEAMAMMIRAKIRHLPVVDKDRVCALVCLEDLVGRHVGALSKELHYLKDYISTLQDAIHD